MKKALALCLAFLLLPVQLTRAQSSNEEDCNDPKLSRDAKVACECKKQTANTFHIVGPLINTNSADDPAQIHGRGAEGRDVDWGLALSGGGIRSASFSIGVLKALYDKRLLDEIDVISSVSGGGYGSYWLLTSYDESNPRRFGESALAGEVFLKNVCELEETSDFLKLGGILRRIFAPKKKSIDYYQERLTRSFMNPRNSNSDNASQQKLSPDPRRITFLNRSIAGGHAPYFIFNASVNTRVSGFAGLVEITPDYIGNPVLGFRSGPRTTRGPLSRPSRCLVPPSKQN